MSTPSRHCIKTGYNNTWYKAREHCQQNSADLIILDDGIDQDFIKNLRYNVN